MSWIVSVARWTMPNYFNLAKTTNTIRVLTISISHYCEFAIWALKLGGFNYVEHGFAPAQHVLPTLALRVGGPKKFLSDSSRVEPVNQQNRPAPETEEEKRKAQKKDATARSTAVPVAVLPNGEVLLDSWSIARYSKLKDTVTPELKKLLDVDLAPLSRQYVYCHLLKESNISYFDRLCTENRHWAWRLCWTLFARSQVVSLMRKVFRPDDAAAYNQCRDKLIKTIDELNKLVESRNTKYLFGDELTLADIAVAALCAPAVCAPEYCEGKYTHIFDELLKTDSAVNADVQRWRNTAVGKYTLELYRNHRL